MDFFDIEASDYVSSVLNDLTDSQISDIVGSKSKVKLNNSHDFKRFYKVKKIHIMKYADAELQQKYSKIFLKKMGGNLLLYDVSIV